MRLMGGHKNRNSLDKTCKKNDVKVTDRSPHALPKNITLTFDQLQKGLVSRLSILVWMNKPDFDTMGLDDLYNNFKIVEQKVKKSAGASNDDKNLAFVTTSDGTTDLIGGDMARGRNSGQTKLLWHASSSENTDTPLEATSNTDTEPSSVKSNSQLNHKGFVDSGCSRHMTGNIAHLLDFKDFDRGYGYFLVEAHMGGRITSKGSTKEFLSLGREKKPEVNTGSREVSTAVPEVNTATPEDLVGPSHASEDTQVEDQEIELGNIPQSYAYLPLLTQEFTKITQLNI
ncbi:hypothetical protein Tco_0826402 [Tanacetum coccineum]